MSKHRFAVIAALLLVGSTLPAQGAPAAQVDLTGREFDLLRDVIAAQWRSYKGQDDQLCLDPTVAAYRANASAPRERWSNDVVSRVAASVRISLDTLTTELFGNLRGCARSRDLWRLAYGRPRIYPDSAAMVFVSTRLDSRGQVDTLKVDFRIVPQNGKWHVDGWLADSMAVHNYVKGEGCYRLWYEPLRVPLRDRTRIDTMELVAEPTALGPNWRSLPAFRLTTRAGLNRFAASPGTTSTWQVTHDSIHFEWWGFGGSESFFADVHIVGDSLRGTLRFETDAIVRNPPTTSIDGRRTACTNKRE